MVRCWTAHVHPTFFTVWQVNVSGHHLPKTIEINPKLCALSYLDIICHYRAYTIHPDSIASRILNLTCIRCKAATIYYENSTTSNHTHVFKHHSIASDMKRCKPAIWQENVSIAPGHTIDWELCCCLSVYVLHVPTLEVIAHCSLPSRPTIQPGHQLSPIQHFWNIRCCHCCNLFCCQRRR